MNLDRSTNPLIKKALWSNVVGGVMQLCRNCRNEKGTISESVFYDYYKDKQGVEGLNKSYEMIMQGMYKEYPDSSLEEKKDTARKWIYKRVIKDTVVGFEWEMRVKNFMKSKGFEMTYADDEVDKLYSVDLEGEDFAIQVKPITYKKGSNEGLMADKKMNIGKNEMYEKYFGKKVYLVYYLLDKPEIVLGDLINIINNK